MGDVRGALTGPVRRNTGSELSQAQRVQVDYSRYLVGIWALKVYTFPLLGPFGKEGSESFVVVFPFFGPYCRTVQYSRKPYSNY